MAQATPMAAETCLEERMANSRWIRSIHDACMGGAGECLDGTGPGIPPGAREGGVYFRIVLKAELMAHAAMSMSPSSWHRYQPKIDVVFLSRH